MKRLLTQDVEIAEEVPAVYQVSEGILRNIKGDPFQNRCHKDGSTSTCWERDDIFQELSWNHKTFRKDNAPTTGQSTLLSTAGIVFI